MKRHLLLSVLLLAFCFHAQAWDIGVNRENKGKQSNWKWRIYTNGWDGLTGPGPSQLLYVYDAGGGRNLYGNIDLAWDLWDTRVHNIDTGDWAYFWRGKPYTVLGDGLFKDTGITGVTNMNFTYSSSMIAGGPFTPINIQVIGDRCFQNSGIQGEVINYTPASITSLGHYAFAECRSLSGNLTTPQHVQLIKEGTYKDCTGMTGNIYIQPGVVQIGAGAFTGCYNLRGTLTWFEGLQRIDDNAFNNCQKLTGNIYIPNSVNHMGTGVFAFCYGFNGTIDYADNMTTVPDYTFLDCRNVTGSVVLPPNVSSIGKQAFQNCWSLNGGIWFQGNVTSIGSSAFDNCQRLTGGINLKNVTALGDRAFQNCRALNNLILPDNLGYIPEACFNECHSLTGNLIIPNAAWIGKYAFQNCWNLNGYLSLPSNLTVIWDRAFYQCNKLQGQLILPNSLQYIGESAFALIGSLTGPVTIPASVHSLHNECFNQMFGIESFTFAPGSQLANLGTSIWKDNYSLKYIDMVNCVNPVSTTISRATGAGPFGRTPPYTIVYLPNGTNPANIPSDQENFVVNGQCANFKVYDTHAAYKNGRGCDYPIQHQFTAAKANYTRTFSGTDAMTLFLPYPTTLPAGMTAYELKNMKRAGGESLFVFSPLPSSATLEANKAYIVRVTDGGSHNLPEMHNVVVPVTPALASTAVLGTADNNWQFNGTTQFIPNVLAASMKAYNLNAGNTWLPVTTANTNGHIHSFRGFLTSPTGMAPAKSFVMVMDEGPTVTDIDSVRKGEADVRSGRYPFYSLDGRNLGRDYNRLPSGNIYIVNGKKFYKN